MKIISHTLAETESFAKETLSKIGSTKGREKAIVIGLYGDLGSGKTAFTQTVARILGISETVTSPTYVIEKIYSINSLPTGFKHLIHIDAYRLDTPEELSHLGWQDIIQNPDNLVVIEWPERVASIMPEHIRINFTFVNETTREIEFVD